MIKRLGFCFLVGSFILLLPGCSSLQIEESILLPIRHDITDRPNNTKQLKSMQLTSSNLPLVLPVPKQPNQINDINRIRPTFFTDHYDWNSIIQQMISNLLQNENIVCGSILLAESDNISNDDNSLNIEETRRILRIILAKKSKFTLIPEQKLLIIRQKLGLLPQDSLNTRSKEIGIARDAGARYILYSSIIRNNRVLILQMQLMSVQNGEILWSEEKVI